jgi:hypothetical protein
MGSPRHWNVERHICRLHRGIGEPVNEFGKIEEQSQIGTNLQYGDSCQNTHPQLAPFPHNQFKDFRFTTTNNYGRDNSSNSNKKRWDFIDEIIQPVKKILEFNEVLAKLSTLRQQHTYRSPSAIPYEYPFRLSTPINWSNVGSMNIGNNSDSKSLTNESNSNNKRIAEEEPILKQLHARAANWYQSRDWSSPSRHWWE